MPAPAQSVPKRAKLADLNPHFYCSILGTCLSTDALRRVASRHLDTKGLSDLEVHHAAVSGLATSGELCRSIHKALDAQHAAAIQRASAIQDAQSLLVFWQDALQDGDVPACYWAVLTHQNATLSLHRQAFGDVHMLSHLVGGAHRADLRMLHRLKSDNARLREESRDYADRLLTVQAARDTALAEAQSEISRLRGEISGLQDRLGVQQRVSDTMTSAQLEAVTRRQAMTEKRAKIARAQANQLQANLTHHEAKSRQLAEELASTEAQLAELLNLGRQDAGLPAAATAAQMLSGSRLLYVGGRPSSTPSIRNFVEYCGAEFVHHDGGYEDRKGLLSSAIAGADFVVFPVDCVDHDSAQMIKRLCSRHDKLYLPIRRASLASLSDAVQRLAKGITSSGSPRELRPLAPHAA